MQLTPDIVNYNFEHTIRKGHSMTPKTLITPSSHWHADRQPDPYGDRYDCERTETVMGHLSDDELASAMFVCNHRESLESIGYLTAAKDRIRWLSRALERALAAASPQSNI